VKKALRNGLEPPKPRGRHSALPDDSEAEADILAWVQHQAEKSQPATRIDILHYCASKFVHAFSRGDKSNESQNAAAESVTLLKFQKCLSAIRKGAMFSRQESELMPCDEQHAKDARDIFHVVSSNIPSMSFC
jgi:hypothetical protein